MTQAGLTVFNRGVPYEQELQEALSAEQGMENK